MPTQADELQYINAVKWIHEHPQDKRISDEIKKDFLSFNTLPPEIKAKLLITLRTLIDATRLPQEIEKSLPWLTFDLEALPEDMHTEIRTHLNQERDISNLVSISRGMYHLFQPKRLLDKFLQRVAYGEQDKVGILFTNLYHGNVEKIQKALRHRGKFTDYSGRTFHCTAYEYAYWAKDTHMCRMLERHMDEATKAQILPCINKIERIDEATKQPLGLKYKQNGAEHQSAHFDLIPLIMALQEYVNGYGAWVAAHNWVVMEAAWMKVGMAQCDVPAHIAQEYCHPTRAFHPTPSFNIDRDDIPQETLPRVLAVYNWNNDRDDLWLPLVAPDSGLGHDFAFTRARWGRWCCAGVWGAGDWKGDWVARRIDALFDLAAITHLDKVRTDDLTLSREHLSPRASTPGMSM